MESTFDSDQRADWYAQGMPKDHPYARWLKEEIPVTVQGLVTFEDGSFYGGAR